MGFIAYLSNLFNIHIYNLAQRESTLQVIHGTLSAKNKIEQILASEVLSFVDTLYIANGLVDQTVTIR